MIFVKEKKNYNERQSQGKSFMTIEFQCCAFHFGFKVSLFTLIY